MDRRSWLWRRKSLDKSPGPGETESSGGSVSSHSERFSDDQVFLNLNSHSHEISSKYDPRTNEHIPDAKILSEKLSEALSSIKAKEELANQHAKVAEEAVSGWEKAEREVLALRQQVEVLTARNSTLEDRVFHLDAALKECLRQLRQTREEKDQIAHEALEKKNSETESCLTSIDSELHHKLEMAEKENSDLKLELSSMAEELEVRIIEKELSNQAAEQASKLHLENAKKVVNLEAECRRLNSVLQKANDHQSKARTKPSITEVVDFKKTHRFGRNRMDSFVEINLMYDFLEMERLVALPESSKAEEKSTKEHEKELQMYKKQLEESESKLAKSENELKMYKIQLEESKFKSENELNIYKNLLKESESKLEEKEMHLEMAEAGVEAIYAKKEEAEARCKGLQTEISSLLSKVESLEGDVQNERNLSQKSQAKCQEFEDLVSGLQNKVQNAESETRKEQLKFLKVKQETGLAMAGSKFAACQKTIASLDRQLKALATLDDFLMDTNDS